MTIRPDDEGRNEAPLKGESAFSPAPTDSQSQSQDQDLPPSYTPTTANSASGSASVQDRPSPPSHPSALANASRSSHVSLTSHNSGINASHVIDLNVPVPFSALPPPTEAEEIDGVRVNGFWFSRNGSVKLKLGIKGKEGGSDVKGDGRVRVIGESRNGSVHVSVLSRLPLTHPPLTLTLLSTNGSLYLLLPRSFRGPITHLTSNGTVKISPALKPYYTPITKERGFVGDMDGWDGEVGGLLDEARCKTRNGGVKIGWVDEGEEEEGGKGKGWLGGWFGGSRAGEMTK